MASALWLSLPSGGCDVPFCTPRGVGRKHCWVDQNSDVQLSQCGFHSEVSKRRMTHISLIPSIIFFGRPFGVIYALESSKWDTAEIWSRWATQKPLSERISTPTPKSTYNSKINMESDHLVLQVILIFKKRLLYFPHMKKLFPYALFRTKKDVSRHRSMLTILHVILGLKSPMKQAVFWIIVSITD